MANDKIGASNKSKAPIAQIHDRSIQHTAQKPRAVGQLNMQNLHAASSIANFWL